MSKFGDAVNAPVVCLFMTGTERRVPKLPDREGEKWNDERRKGAYQKGERETQRNGRRRGKMTWKQEGEGSRETTTGKKLEASTMNGKAGGKNVKDGVLVVEAKKTFRDKVNRDVKLVPHATRGSERVVDEAEVVKKKIRRSGASSKSERLRDSVDTSARSGASRGGLMLGQEGINLFATVRESLWKEVVLNEGTVEAGARGMRKRDQREVWSREVAATPKVDSGSVAVVSNKLTLFKANIGELVVLKAGVDETRTGGEKRNIEGPKVFERRADGEEVVERNKRVVRVGASIKRGDKLANHFFERRIKFIWENKKQEVVGEERDNEGVNKQDARLNREGRNNGAGARNSIHRFLVGAVENVAEGDFGADSDTQMSGNLAKWEQRPRTNREIKTKQRTSRRRTRGDDAAFVLVDSEAR